MIVTIMVDRFNCSKKVADNDDDENGCLGNLFKERR